MIMKGFTPPGTPVRRLSAPASPWNRWFRPRCLA